LQAFLDLAARLGGALAQPSLELVEGRRGDEDRDGGGFGVANRPRAFRLQLEHAALAGAWIRSTSERSVP
jgi:hypothetical protein